MKYCDWLLILSFTVAISFIIRCIEVRRAHNIGTRAAAPGPPTPKAGVSAQVVHDSSF